MIIIIFFHVVYYWEFFHCYKWWIGRKVASLEFLFSSIIILFKAFQIFMKFLCPKRNPFVIILSGMSITHLLLQTCYVWEKVISHVDIEIHFIISVLLCLQWYSEKEFSNAIGKGTIIIKAINSMKKKLFMNFKKLSYRVLVSMNHTSFSASEKFVLG